MRIRIVPFILFVLTNLAVIQPIHAAKSSGWLRLFESPDVTVYTPFGLQEKKMLLIVGGLKERPEHYSKVAKFMSRLGYNVAFFQQMTENESFSEPLYPLVRDFDNALWRLQDTFAVKEFKILAHSMAWATLESWRQGHEVRRAGERSGVIHIVYSNPALTFDPFLTTDDIEVLSEINDHYLMSLGFLMNHRGTIRRLRVTHRRTSLIQAYRKWLSQLQDASFDRISPIPTTFLIADDDPNLKVRLVDRYASRLTQKKIPVSVYHLEIPSPQHRHNFWRLNNLEIAKTLALILGNTPDVSLPTEIKPSSDMPSLVPPCIPLLRAITGGIDSLPTVLKYRQPGSRKPLRVINYR